MENTPLISSKLHSVFEEIAKNNSWGDRESVSGSGSTFNATIKIRNEIPKLLMKYGIRSILDLPCGDINWIKFLFPFIESDNIRYTGADIATSVLNKNYHHEGELIKFETLDMCNSKLPQVDLIFSRDVLGHLDYENCFKALVNIKNSGAKYWLTTSFVNTDNVLQDIQAGQWYPINLLRSPFNLIPIEIINEGCIEGRGAFRDKSLMLFDISNNDFISDRSALRTVKVNGKGIL